MDSIDKNEEKGEEMDTKQQKRALILFSPFSCCFSGWFACTCNDLTRASFRVSYSNIHYGCTKCIIIIPTIQHSTLLTITHTTQTTILSYFIILHGSMHRHYHCPHHHTSLHYYCSQRVLVSHSQIITIQFPAFSTRKNLLQSHCRRPK